MECKILTIQSGGRPLPGASVLVMTAGVPNPLPTVYSAGSNATPTGTLSNPMTTDANGEVQFAMPDGAYDIQISGSGIATQTLYRQMFWDQTTASAAPFSQVGLSMPSPLTVSGSPAGPSGTLAVTWTTGQAAAKVLATPATTTGAVALISLAKEHLPASGVTPGTYGSATKSAVPVVDTYGRITGITEPTITPAFSSITGTPTTIKGYGISDGVKVQFTQQGAVGVTATSETTLLGTGTGSLTLAANQLQVGTVIRIRMFGWITVTSTTLTLKIKLGGTTILTTGADSLGTSITNKAFWMEADLVCTGVGVSGVIDGGMLAFGGQSTNNFLEGGVLGAGVNVDTTGTLAVDVTAQWGGAGCQITSRSVTVEVLRGA